MSLELKKRIGTSFFLIILLILMFNYSFLLVILTIIIALISWVEFYALISKIFKKNNLKEKIKRSLAKVFSLIYLSTIVFILITNYELKDYIFFTLLISIFSDIGGLSVGKIFKGKKLTKISPNKTISGSIGSFVISLFLVPIFYYLVPEKFANFYHLLLLALSTSFICQLGDLFISYIKRKAKVKNTGDLLPGHGGILDRIDGMIFAIPIGILIFELLKIIG